MRIGEPLPPGLARLEIIWQALVISTDGEGAAEAPCDRRTSVAGSALPRIGRPPEVRWQTLDDPSRWPQARVSVPALRGATSRAMEASVRRP